MAKPEKREFNVTVLNRREITIWPKVGQEVKQLLVTYVAAGLPPHTLTFDKLKYSKELEKKTIRLNIEARLKEKPESFTV
uniref:Uncharacterized protein n=1 Tax=viral metagenome TaxID=1070528 RepID=A0A6H1ZXS7_9ZZZZ